MIKYFKYMENKKSLSTIMFAVALLLFVCAIFAMFGKVIAVNDGGPIPNMFQAAFGTSTPGADGIRTKGLTTVFIFQMIITAGVIAILVGAITNKFHYILMIVLYGVVCLCAFITFIVSFNTLGNYLSSGHSYRPGATLGVGPIIYSIMHILGLLLSAGGLVLSRRGK